MLLPQSNAFSALKTRLTCASRLALVQQQQQQQQWHQKSAHKSKKTPATAAPTPTIASTAVATPMVVDAGEAALAAQVDLGKLLEHFAVTQQRRWQAELAATK